MSTSPSATSSASLNIPEASRVSSHSSSIRESPTRSSQKISNARRYFLFAVLCIANILDAYNLNALFTGLPALKEAFGLSEVDASWVVSVFQLTYASFLLISGRISDVYHPKPIFVLGVFALGILSLGAGFVQNKIGLIIIRAFCGICAALSIPSSLALIVRFFPEPHEQSIAIALFGGFAALANVFGTIISALFVEFADYRWIFWFTTILAIPAALLCIVLVPSQERPSEESRSAQRRVENLKRLDVIGVAALTAALVLFIFAITSGSESGWASAQVLAPLIISIFLLVAFFFWEAYIPEELASVPPRIWFLPNFSVLFGASLLPYFWWTTVFVVFFPLWQQVFGWSAIRSGLQMIPIGISATLMSFTIHFGKQIPRKVYILVGLALAAIGTVLFTFGDAHDTYWRFVFPGIILGSSGTMLVYVHVSIAIFQTAPSSMAGVIGAMFNCAIQLGAALGLAIDTSIESSIEAKPGSGGFDGFAGRRATLWWLFAAVSVEALAVLIFFHEARIQSDSPATDSDMGEKSGAEDAVDGEKQTA